MATFQAPIHPGWVRSMIQRSLLFFAFASWFIYDGVYAWPKQTKAAEAYMKFIEEGNSKHDWPKHARELGLGKVKEFYTHEHVKNQRQINEQFVWAGGLALVGLGFLGWIVVNRGKTLGYDDEALIGPDGKRVPLNAIQEISTDKWDNKGLAYVRYKEDSELKKLTVDDLKFNGAEKVLEKAQAHLGQELESAKRARLKAEEAQKAESVTDSVAQGDKQA